MRRRSLKDLRNKIISVEIVFDIIVKKREDKIFPLFYFFSDVIYFTPPINFLIKGEITIKATPAINA